MVQLSINQLKLKNIMCKNFKNPRFLKVLLWYFHSEFALKQLQQKRFNPYSTFAQPNFNKTSPNTTDSDKRYTSSRATNAYISSLKLVYLTSIYKQLRFMRTRNKKTRYGNKIEWMICSLYINSTIRVYAFVSRYEKGNASSHCSICLH